MSLNKSKQLTNQYLANNNFTLIFLQNVVVKVLNKEEQYRKIEEKF